MLTQMRQKFKGVTLWTVQDSLPAGRQGTCHPRNLPRTKSCGPCRIRTGDLRIANAALYQLS